MNVYLEGLEHHTSCPNIYTGPTPFSEGHIQFTTDSTPTLQAIRKFIVHEVAEHWILIAVYLGFESSAIMMTKTDRSEHACTAVFEQWLSWEPETGEKERTWQTVLSAVEYTGHKAFSRQLKTELFRLQ